MTKRVLVLAMAIVPMVCLYRFSLDFSWGGTRAYGDGEFGVIVNMWAADSVAFLLEWPWMFLIALTIGALNGILWWYLDAIKWGLS